MRTPASILGLWLCGCAAPLALGQYGADSPAQPADQTAKESGEADVAAAPPLEPEGGGAQATLKEKVLRDFGEDLEVDAWIWLAYLFDAGDVSTDFYDAVFSAAATKFFDQSAAISAQVNVIDADGSWRFEVAQGYLSARLWDDALLTVGKFNANFGVERRDFWLRTTGTTSLLFNAQPQDLVGAMLTQPLGDSGIKLKPFVSIDFQGDWYYDRSPAVGLLVEYRPDDNLRLAVTNWVGPGFVLFGGEELHAPFPQDAYGSGPASAVVNWQGPNLVAEGADTLYFLDGSVVWRVRPDLRLSFEALLGTTVDDGTQSGWWGALAMAEFDITDRIRTYARWSYLDDKDWLITGFFQRRHEVSVGAGWDIFEGVEVRAEYRHDFTEGEGEPDTDFLSFHLSFTF